MGIGNNLRILSAKWWVVVLVAVVGALLGSYLAKNHNDSIDSRWKAQAPVTFIAFTDDDSSGSAQTKNSNSTSSDIDAQAEGVRAQLLLEDTLRENPKLSIQVDRANNVLLFTAIGRDGDETLQQAVALRGGYRELSSEVLNIDQINETVDSLLVEIQALNQRIDAAQPPEVEPEDTAITTVRATLQAQIDTLVERQTQLRIWIVNPELRPTEDEFFGIEPDVASRSGSTETTIAAEPVIISNEDLQREFDENTRILNRLNTQMLVVPEPPPAPELDDKSTLALAAMQAETEELQAQYIELLQVVDGRSPGGFFEEPTATDETAATRPVGIFTLVGFLAGALVASIVLIGLDKSRKTAWSATSLGNVTCLGTIDRNRADGLPGGVWYPTSVSRRRRDIQTFRATVDAFTSEQPAVVGFFGVSTPSIEVGELAADLATAYAVAGRDVLLIDANAFNLNQLTEYGDQSASLTRILIQNLPVQDAVAAIDELIDATPQVIPHLTSLHIDAATHDPIDAIASPNSRSLMDIARHRFDIVIVAGPAISDPLSDTVARRIDYAVLTGLAGTTTEPQISTASAILKDRRTDSPGVVLLHGHRESFRAKLSRMYQSIRSAVDSTVDRSGSNGDESPIDVSYSAEAKTSV
jgi:hypothetical protein